ncbi:MAG: tRNA 2-selenouridine(34) synthase MnmH [Synechococcus sp.]
MLSPLSISDFLAVPGPILDVRSPGEFARAHIPGAMNFPLFSDEERAEVGTCYKHEGREQAVELGFEIVGPKCASFVKRAKRLAGDRQVRLHCWRGGMRSASMGWLLQTAGLKVSLLEGGYKAFRGWCLQQLQLPRPVILLGGMTGSGKTYILQALERLGEQIIDLEGLANHRGSSYGALGLPDQPSTEQFENKLAMEWHQLDPRRRVWLEAESRAVGSCRIPAAVFAQMEAAPVIRVRRSRQERIETISEMYGESDIEGLIAATQRIRKRLGGQRTQTAIAHLEQGEVLPAIDAILPYYDKTYTYDLERRDTPAVEVDIIGKTPVASALLLVKQANALSIQGSG